MRLSFIIRCLVAFGLTGLIAANVGPRRAVYGTKQTAVASGSPNFMADGASFPWSQPDIDPPHLYVASTNTTWFSWQGYQSILGASAKRVVEFATYNHTTGVWKGNFIAGTSNTLVASDLHGVPDIVRDASGCVYAYYDTHNSAAVQISATVAPDDPTFWYATSLAINPVTFPKALLVGSSIYLFWNGGTDQETISFKVGTPSGCAVTYGASQAILQDAAAWLPPGSYVVRGTDIHLCFSSGPQNKSTRQDIFWAVLDTTTGNVHNFDNSVSVAPGSQPVPIATLQASFRIFATAVQSGQPVCAFDNLGTAHAVFGDSSTGGGINASLLHMSNAGAGWSATHTVFAYPAAVTAFNAVDAAIVPNAANGIDVYFADGASAQTSLDIGNIQVVTRSSGGSWGATTQVAAKGATFGLAVPTAIIPSHANAQVAWAEVTNDETTISGALKGFAYGAGGVLSRVGAIGLATGFSTLDPANTSANITLSLSNQKGNANTSLAAGNVSRIGVGHSSGKFCWQVTIGSTSTSDTAVGLIGTGQTVSGKFLGDVGSNSIGHFGAGQIFFNNAQTATVNSYANGNVVTECADFDNNKAWWQTNGGLWNNSASDNPATNTGGISISTLTKPIYFAIELDVLNRNMTINAGGLPFTVQPPAGFSLP